MKAVPGMAVILILLLLGEVVVALLDLPIPGSVVGMVLMAAGLGARLIRLAWVEETASFLTKNLAFFFVPAGVGLMAYFDLLGREWRVILFATLFSTLFVLVPVGLFHRLVSRRGKGRT